MHILDALRQRFSLALQPLVSDPSPHVQRIARSRDNQHGDYQANLAMGLAKELRRDPVEVAQEVIGKLDLTDICQSVEVAGKGFINLTLHSRWLAAQLSEMLADDRLGIPMVAAPKTYVIDYSSPNVAKPMHVGHIRSTVIGDAIKHILSFLGHHTISDNHLGDWGTQFGMIIYGYKHFVEATAYQAAPVQELSRLYRVVQQLIGYQASVASLAGFQSELDNAQQRIEKCNNALASSPKDAKLLKQVKAAERALSELGEKRTELEKKIDSVQADPWLKNLAILHPQLDQRVLQETAKLHFGDAENRSLWNQFLPHCILEIRSVYDRLHVRFDYEYGESFYHDMLAPVVDDLVARKLAVESDGATCVFLEGYDAPMIIRKQDGAFLYATTDLATVEYRIKHFKPNAILYVVDHRQSEHFAKLFATLRTIGIEDVEFRHISFGTVLGPDGKPFKTRSGSIVGLESLLDEAVQRAWQVVCNPTRLSAASIEMSEKEKREIAETVGIGAIKYADLVHNRTSDYEFDIERMVQLEGNTSAYIQYSYSRTQSILRKCEVDPNQNQLHLVPIVLQVPIERELAIHMIRLEEVLEQSLEDYMPNIVAAYLYDLAKLFASFYDQCDVMRESNPEVAKSRQALVFLTGQILKRGLGLLGIGVVPRM